jgi:hypothetical protein
MKAACEGYAGTGMLILIIGICLINVCFAPRSTKSILLFWPWSRSLHTMKRNVKAWKFAWSGWRDNFVSKVWLQSRHLEALRASL